MKHTGIFLFAGYTFLNLALLKINKKLIDKNNLKLALSIQ